jgi:hypothetical protein
MRQGLPFNSCDGVTAFFDPKGMYGPGKARQGNGWQSMNIVLCGWRGIVP